MNHWGRIFFTYDENDQLEKVMGQPLENHVNNCREILEMFHSRYFHRETKTRLLKAVSLHDEGKKDTFRIREGNGNGISGDKKQNPFIYSFSGHRFRVPKDDPYIDALIRSHHAFSVEQINREKAGLKTESDKIRFPDDLYLLCMADHLEAELAVKTVENKKGDISRTFMEFVTRKIEEENNSFTVIPWPFEKDSFHLNFHLKQPDISGFRNPKPKQIQDIFQTGKQFEEFSIQIEIRSL
jgi:CRISPR-associated endonuclease/helicase Cas3